MMKYPIYILLFILFILESEASNFDKIEIIDTSIVWTEFEEYDKSDIKIKPSGLIVEYDNHLVYKNEKGDGNFAYQFSNSLGELEKYFWLYHDQNPDTVNSFDVYPESNIIFYTEYIVNDNGEFILFIEKMRNDSVESLIDTTFSIRMSSKRIFLNFYTGFDRIKPPNILRINQNEFLIELVYYVRMDRDYYEEDNSNVLINVKDNTIREIENIDYLNLSFVNDKKSFGAFYKSKYVGYIDVSYGADEFNFFNIESNSFNQLANYSEKDGETNSKHVKMLNDSLAFFQYENSLYIYNYQSNIEESKFSYQNLTLHNSVIVDDKYLLFDSKRYDDIYRSIIHIPSQNMILDTALNQPYQGYLLTQLKNDQILSIGDSNYVYRSNLDFELDMVKADFDYELTDDLTYKFKDRSQGPLVSWAWDFGDGYASYDRNPIYKFDGEGTYEVKLIVENEFGSKDTAATEVKIKKKVKALFTSSGPSGKAPHTVTFKSLYNTNVVKWIWNFGDYNYSYEQSPTHTFTKPGVYGVSLTVFDEDGDFDIYKFDDFITVEE